MAFFNFLLPLFITITSYGLMEQKLKKTGHPQVRQKLGQEKLLLGTPDHMNDVTENKQKFAVFCMMR